MKRPEYADLLEYTREASIRERRPDLDPLLLRRADQLRDDDPKGAMIEYLEALRIDAELASTRAVARVNERLSTISRDFTGVTVLVDPRDQATLNLEGELPLQGEVRADRAVELIDNLIAELREDESPWV